LSRSHSPARPPLPGKSETIKQVRLPISVANLDRGPNRKHDQNE